MASIVTSGVAVGKVPPEAGYTRGFGVLCVGAVFAAGAAILVPRLRGRPASLAPGDGPHAELAIVAAGTLTGSGPE
jgi:hypothetical protein